MCKLAQHSELLLDITTNNSEAVQLNSDTTDWYDFRIFLLPSLDLVQNLSLLEEGIRNYSGQGLGKVNFDRKKNKNA